jgi:hypothetical protein
MLRGCGEVCDPCEIGPAAGISTGMASMVLPAASQKATRSAIAVTKHQLLVSVPSISSRASRRNRRKLRTWFLWGIAAKAIIELASASSFFCAAHAMWATPRLFRFFQVQAFGRTKVPAFSRTSGTYR